jgi:hypothetical protein
LYCAAISVMHEAVRPIELSEILLAERIEHGETSPLIEAGLFGCSGMGQWGSSPIDFAPMTQRQ